MFKQIIVETLEQNGHHVVRVATPLGNEMILDGKWLLEMDRDGAFAVTVSSIEKDMGAYSDTHKLIVFHNILDCASDENKPVINSQIMKVMDELERVKM